MGLEFITNAEGGLLVKLDEVGVGELPASVAQAMQTGEPQWVPVDRNAPSAIGELTLEELDQLADLEDRFTPQRSRS